MGETNSGVRYSRYLSNNSIDTSSFQILTDSENSSPYDKRQKVKVGALIGLVLGVLLISLLVLESTSSGSTDLENEALSTEKTITLNPTFTARNTSNSMQGKQF